MSGTGGHGGAGRSGAVQTRDTATVSTPAGRQVLLVGATQGLGLGLADKYLREGWQVIATTIVPSPGLDALLARHGARLRVVPLDITDVAAVRALVDSLREARLDALHVVAGVFQASFDPLWEQPDAEILRLLHTNSIGGIRLAEWLAPRVAADGVFAFTSSGMGSMARNDKGDVDLYRISKAALNMLVRSFAARQRGSGRRVLLLCPGWAKTAMGGPDATVEVSTSVDGMYRLVVDTPPGADREALFFEYSGDVVPW